MSAPHAAGRWTLSAGRWALGMCALVGLAFGCASQRPAATRAGQQPALADDAAMRLAAQVAGYHRSADIVAVDLLVRVKPAGRDALQFSVNLWSTADGRVRIALSKVGVSGFEALIHPDGAIGAVGRGGERVVDDLEAAFADDVAADAHLALLIEEFKRGPLPAARSFTAAGRTLSCTDPATGLRVVVTLAADSPQAVSKSFTDAKGTEILRFDYARYKNLDGLQRPSLITIVVPSAPGAYAMRVQNVDVLPAIGEQRMALTLPDGAAMDFAGFVRQLGE